MAWTISSHFFTKIAHETSNAKFSYIEIWFIDQSSKPLET